MSDYACQGAEMLHETLRTFDPYTLPKSSMKSIRSSMRLISASMR